MNTTTAMTQPTGHGASKPGSEPTRRTATALVDVYENHEEYLLVADVPGAQKETVAISYQDNQLSLSAGVNTREGGFDYKRVLTVGSDVDSEKIRAELDRGVLRVHLPKAESAKPREIPVTVA
ncbi:MAG: Hsp20/alpha crystallin family protein [Deltaproteobacteria bacterium]|nr:Hsp20/alpha crystallin family protein [Deltaproteobacteria bacterium]